MQLMSVICHRFFKGVLCTKRPPFVNLACGSMKKVFFEHVYCGVLSMSRYPPTFASTSSKLRFLAQFSLWLSKDFDTKLLLRTSKVLAKTISFRQCYHQSSYLNKYISSKFHPPKFPPLPKCNQSPCLVNLPVFSRLPEILKQK